jgi:putative membrane protein
MGGGSWILLAGLVLLLFIGALVLLGVLLYGAARRDRRERVEGPLPPDREARLAEENALEILNRRYARGQISREEYLSMKEDLEETPL